MYGQTRILFAMDRDGLLPARFASVNARTMTPVSNTVIVVIAAATLAGFVPLEELADMVSIGTLTAFIVVAVGVIVLHVREPELPRGFKVPCHNGTFGAGLRLHPGQPVLVHLDCVQRVGVGRVGFSTSRGDGATVRSTKLADDG